jgi:hypothetical protein
MADKRAAVERQNQPHADQASQFFADVANAAARAAGRALTCEITNGRFFDEVLKGSKLTRQIRK